MQLNTPRDVFLLSIGDTVTKRNLFDLIQYSKVESSAHWGGHKCIIHNTPQQGINWIGELPRLTAVIIKTRPGSYKHDGWSNQEDSEFHYSFKSRNQIINYQEKANQSLIQQPQAGYPILLFTESGTHWTFEGQFAVSEIETAFVVLRRNDESTLPQTAIEPAPEYHEGRLRYVAHLLAERNQHVVEAAKNVDSWACEICRINFGDVYGVQYIEVHHKTPISEYTEKHKVQVEDLALLCPNCHRAVHLYMQKDEMEYQRIVRILQELPSLVTTTTEIN